MIPIVTIEGATASGKSALALELAAHYGSEIISADSRQVYRYLDIGTAKASLEDRARIPHHLIDIINPDQSYNAGAFAGDAAKIIEKLHLRGKLPIICGGTGLYIRSLLEGLFLLPDLPPQLRAELKHRLAVEGLPALYLQLCRLDPVFAAKISPQDSQRVLRGLEVVLGTGVALSEHWRMQKQQSRYKAFRIWMNPPRELLYQRINTRLQKMMEAGLLAEIASLFARGYTAASPGLNSLGYKEFLPLFIDCPLGTPEAGEFTPSPETARDCALLAAQHQRNYAKRQVTWYRKENFDLALPQSQISLSHISKIINDSCK